MALPRLHLISTGGTIAGRAHGAGNMTDYQAGALGPDTLLQAVPELAQLADIHCEALFALDSKDSTPAHWLMLARAVEAARQQPACDAVLITHGTDTLEESAFFLEQVLPPGKPVVLTAAMRPATAHSADGPMNLLQAAAVAVHPASRERGVLVVLNDDIHAARHVAKTHTQALGAIASPAAAPIGQAWPVRYCQPPCPARCAASAVLTATALPAVEILYVAAGSSPGLLQALTGQATPPAGVVLALPGNGSLPTAWYEAIAGARARGLFLVRASRIAHGPVSPLPAAHPLSTQILEAETLSPLQARVALIVALAQGGNVAEQFAQRRDAYAS